MRQGAGLVAVFGEGDAHGVSLSYVMNGHPKGLAREDGRSDEPSRAMRT